MKLLGIQISQSRANSKYSIAHYDVIILNMKFRVRKTEFQIASDMKLIFLRGKLDEK